MSVPGSNNDNNSASRVSMKRKIPTSNIITDQVPTILLPARKITRITSAPLPGRLQTQDNPNWSPQQYLETMLSEQNIDATVRSYSEVSGFYEETKQSEIDAYDLDVLKAIREGDLEQLRTYHQQGRPLKCSNRFGESLLHLACRKSMVPVVDFLVNEAGVPLNVVDDKGRNPLHDAFWTCEPSHELVDLIIKGCPDLLLISDKRGHTPLAYARRSHWATWVNYLKERSDLVAPKQLVQRKK
jgi:hypothetical protein